MNCKQGDLAVIVRGSAFTKYLGRIVQVVATNGYVWSITESLDGNPDYWILVPDSCLRPIRPSEGQDETLSWKDVPQGEIA